MTIIWVRSTHAPDSRLLKFQTAAQSCGIPLRILRWNRAGVSSESEDVIEIGLRADIGGGWRNLIAICAWNLRLGWTLLRLVRTATHLHAVDLDSILPCMLIGKIFGKKVIFEIYDEYAEARNLSVRATRVIKAIERWCARAADGVILVDECRFEQLGLQHLANSVVIENVPIAKLPSAREASEREDSRLRLSYVGVLQPECRGIEDLLTVVSADPSVVLDLAGVGPLASLCREAASKFSNIRYHGGVDYSRALELMQAADVIVGLYYLNNSNHKYAAPNKFFEHLFLGRALLTSVGTPPGHRVSSADTGWAIEDGSTALSLWLQGAARHAAADKGARARVQWHQSYADYEKVLVGPLYARLLGRRYVSQQG